LADIGVPEKKDLNFKRSRGRRGGLLHEDNIQEKYSCCQQEIDLEKQSAVARE
jgi:hypothetical protein